MIRIDKSSFNEPADEYEHTNESRFRFEVESEINRIYQKLGALESVSGGGFSKGLFRKSAPFFRASITDF